MYLIQSLCTTVFEALQRVTRDHFFWQCVPMWNDKDEERLFVVVRVCTRLKIGHTVKMVTMTATSLF